MGPVRERFGGLREWRGQLREYGEEGRKRTSAREVRGLRFSVSTVCERPQTSRCAALLFLRAFLERQSCTRAALAFLAGSCERLTRQVSRCRQGRTDVPSWAPRTRPLPG